MFIKLYFIAYFVQYNSRFLFRALSQSDTEHKWPERPDQFTCSLGSSFPPVYDNQTVLNFLTEWDPVRNLEKSLFPVL